MCKLILYAYHTILPVCTCIYMHVWYFHYSKVVDIPGILDHSLEERNTIEMQVRKFVNDVSLLLQIIVILV